MTEKAIEALNQSCLQKPAMKRIKVLNWPESDSLEEPLSILSNSIDVSKEKLEAVLHKLVAPSFLGRAKRRLKCWRTKIPKTRKRPVEVLMLDLKWLFRNRKTFVALSTILEDLPNNFYASEFTQNLTKQFWNAA